MHQPMTKCARHGCPHEQAPNPLGLCHWHYHQFKTHTLPPTPTTQHTSTTIAWHLIDRTIGWNHTQRHIARTLGVNKDCIYHIHKRTYARVKRTNWQKILVAATQYEYERAIAKNNTPPAKPKA